jgi:predicted negative regulator of RcsB-dependent stress response
MADSYNEDDDLQRFRQWLRQNGLALVMGVGAGLGAILAWQGWNVYVDDRARGAAEEYTQLRDVLSGGELGAPVRERMATLREKYAATPYAAQGALLYAERLVAAERYDDALAQLQWVTSYADQAGLRHIARVRRARLLWAQDRREQALVLLEHDHPEAFESLYGELAGDIHAAGGDYAAAQTAYRRALEYLPADADPAPLQRKLDNVAIAGDAATGEAA